MKQSSCWWEDYSPDIKRAADGDDDARLLQHVHDVEAFIAAGRTDDERFALLLLTQGCSSVVAACAIGRHHTTVLRAARRAARVSSRTRTGAQLKTPLVSSPRTGKQRLNRGVCDRCGSTLLREPACLRCAVCGRYYHDPSAKLHDLATQYRADQQTCLQSEHSAAYWIAYCGVHPDVIAHLLKTRSDWWENQDAAGQEQ